MILRVAHYELASIPPNVTRVWDETVGAFLRTCEGFLGATVAAGGGSLAVVSRWETVEALETSMSSDAYAAAVADVVQELGLTAETEPTHVFQGDVLTNA